METEWDAVVIGGGFFGCSVAVMLRERGARVVVLEKSDTLLGRASEMNQARIHGGYHYPRSLMTALRSSVNYERFRREYRGCVVDDFEKVYGVGRMFSKVTASQFRNFMERVSAPLAPAPARIRRLFDFRLIEEVWMTRECAFDAVKLREIARAQLDAAGVPVWFGTSALSVRQDPDGPGLMVRCARAGGESEEMPELRAGWVFNCTYSMINAARRGSGWAMLPLKHEMTEMALVDVPDELKRIGITIMCGPFFSLMPYPPRGLHSLSHVRYTPHYSWHDREGADYRDAYRHFESAPKVTNFPYMQRDATRYVPSIRDVRYVDSLWEVKTVLPQSEMDDGRPILFHRAPEHPRFVSIMGGKIDNIFDVPQELEALGLGWAAPRASGV